MCEHYTIPYARLFVWSPSFKLVHNYEDLVVCYFENSTYATLKQIPDLCPEADSFVHYDLPLSAPYSTIEVPNSNTRIFRLQTHVKVKAQAFMDGKPIIDTINTMDNCTGDLATLKMCCTMIGTSIPSSSTLDIVIPQASQRYEVIAALTEAFSRSAPNPPSTDISSTSPDSLLLSENDLDWLSSKGDTDNTAASTQSYEDDRQPWNTSDDRTEVRTSRPAIFMSTYERSLQILDHSGSPAVDILLGSHAQQLKQYWGKHLDDEAGPQKQKAPFEFLHPSVADNIENQSAWNNFAVAHGGTPNRRYEQPEDRMACLQVTDSGGAGGYLADRRRDYTAFIDEAATKSCTNKFGRRNKQTSTATFSNRRGCSSRTLRHCFDEDDV